MSHSPRSRRSNWIGIALSVVFSAGCVHHIFPVVEHQAFVTLPAARSVLSGDSLLSDWNARYRRALGNLRARDGLPSSDCNPCTVQVRITAVEGAKYIDPGSALRQTQLLAWIENLDSSHTEATFHLLPSSQAVYAVVADPSSAGIRIRVVEIFASRDRRPVTYKSSGDLAPCQPYHQPLTSEADFRICPHKMAESGTGGSGSSVSFVGLGGGILLAQSGDPIWFSCNTGCCTGSGMSIVTD